MEELVMMRWVIHLLFTSTTQIIAHLQLIQEDKASTVAHILIKLSKQAIIYLDVIQVIFMIIHLDVIFTL